MALSDKAKRALLAVANHCLTIPDEAWDMYSWSREEPFCGTVGCAIGHGLAAGLPELAECGLCLDTTTYSMPCPMAKYKDADGHECTRNGFSGISKALDIDYDDAAALFDATFYVGDPTQETVASRIKMYVEANGEVDWESVENYAEIDDDEDEDEFFEDEDDLDDFEDIDWDEDDD